MNPLRADPEYLARPSQAPSEAAGSASEKAESGILEIGGRHYAIGVSWLPSDIVILKPIATAKIHAAKLTPKPDLFVYRQTPLARPQIGYGQSRMGHKPGMVVAASILGQHLGQDYIAAFDLGHRHWLVACRDGNVIAARDAVYENAETCAAAMRDLLAFGTATWNKIIAPAAWNLATAEQIPLETLLSDFNARNVARLQSLSRRGLVLRLAMLGCLIFAAGYGTLAYLDWQAELELQRLAAEAAAQSPNANLPELKPWLQAPAIPDFLKACDRALARLYLAIPGWELASLHCDGASAQARWTRKDGQIAHIVQIARQAGLDAPLIADGGESATISLALPQLSPPSSTAAPLSMREGRTRLWNNFQAAGLTIKISDPEPLPPIPSGSAEAPKPPAPKLPILVETAIHPDSIAPLLAIPALALERISWQAQSQTWKMEGNLYAAP